MHEILRGRCLAASLGGQGKHSAHQERMKATVSWKLDKEIFVFSSLVWFNIVTLLSLPGKCSQPQQRTLCFCLGGCAGLPPSPTPDTLNQSPAGSTWIHTNYGSGQRELSCSCFRQAVYSARHFKINYSQIWVYIQASEWKNLKTWTIFFLMGKHNFIPVLKGWCVPQSNMERVDGTGTDDGAHK